jgi:hypothetical protein
MCVHNGRKDESLCFKCATGNHSEIDWDKFMSLRRFDDYVAKQPKDVRCDRYFQSVAEKLRKEFLVLNASTPPKVVERFSDNGEHSHWELIHPVNGSVLWCEGDNGK